jgi:hypothetical protein
VIHSYSSISAFENCPWAFRDRYVLKNKYPETPQQAAGTAAHLALQRRLEDRRALPPELAVAEPMIQSLEKRGRPIAERKLAMTRDFEPCDFWAQEAWMRGVLDVLLPLGTMMDSHGGTVPTSRHAFILDWKNGKVREDHTQLMIQAALLLVNFAIIGAVDVVYIWLKEGRPGESQRYWTPGLPQMLARIVSLTTPIEAAVMNNSFPARPSALCRWCPVAECKERKHEYRP